MHASISRRQFVAGTGGAFAVGTAGCLDGGDGSPTENESNGSDDATNGDDAADSDGDETADEGSDGLVYAFAPESISLLDPERGGVVDELETDTDGAEWGDPRITGDLERIFVAEGNRARLAVVDATRQELEDWIDVGPDPIHLYNPVEGEIWAHSDEEGAFYVVDAETLEVLDAVDSSSEPGGHGKLLTHPDLGDRAYAANVTEPAAATIDLVARERTGAVDLGETGGTHYKAYAPETGYAYFEHQGHGTAVIDTGTDEVVDTLEFAGGMYLSPDDRFLSVIDGAELFVLDATSEESEVLETVEIEGEPGVIRYHERDDGALYGITANVEEPTATVLDFEALTVVDELEIGAVDGRRRAGVAADGYFVTPATAEEAITVVEMESLEVTEIDVGAPADTVQYVGESGTGYSSR